jgi:flavin reductase (DIM6/NTAB) family NADH-FMN oxidoreductase RutF
MKINLGAKNCLYPLPTTIVGATVNGKPNFLAIAHVGIMAGINVSVSMNKRHFTNAGIKENGAFSVNIPSWDMVKETDYIGLASGANTDKSAFFEVFYGQLKTAPLVQKCAINMACRLIKTIDFPQNDLFIGEVVETYCDDACLTDGVVDFEKVRPIIFVMNDRSYYQLGERSAKAFEIGKTAEKK